MAIPFGAFIDIESAPATITDPPAVQPKSCITAATNTDIELAHLSASSYPAPFRPPTHPGTQTPSALLPSRPPSPPADVAVAQAPSWSQPPRNRWRVLAVSGQYVGWGLNDAAAGALMPSLERSYGVGYAAASLVFVAQAAGFVVAACGVDALLRRLGRARVQVLVEALMVAAYAVVAAGVPFAVVVGAFFGVGLSMATSLALNNVFCANLAQGVVVLGAAHGCYGVGGVLAPIIATSLVSRGVPWHRYYFITLVIRVICLVSVGWAFWGYENEAPTRLAEALERTASRRTATEAGEASKFRLLKKALKSKITIIGALFIFSYQGAEVAISGWVISYLIEYRHGDPSHVGYVTSGFWVSDPIVMPEKSKPINVNNKVQGGITAGRFILSHFAHRTGERLFVYVLGSGAIAFQLLVWFVPNVIGDAVAVSILGVLLGPIYPCATTVFARLLPNNIQMSAIGFISSAGSTGGAVGPFLIGLLAQTSGTYVLHPVCIGLFCLMLGCWFSLPKLPKRQE